MTVASPANNPPANVGSGFQRSLFVAVTGSALAVLPVYLLASLAVQLRADLRFGTQSLGIAIAMYHLGAATCSIPLGRLTEAVGGLRVIRVTVLLSVALLVATSAVRGWAQLAFAMLVSGVLSAAMQPSMNLFIARQVTTARHGLALGIKQAAVPLSTVIAGLAVPAIALTIGWRFAFLASAGVALVVWTALPRVDGESASTDDVDRDRATTSGDVGPLVVLTVGFGLAVAAVASLAGFLADAAVNAGVSEGGAGLLMALGGLSACVARVMIGARADRRGGSEHLLAVSRMLRLGSLGLLLLALGMAWRAPVLFIPAVLVAFAVGWGWNGLFDLALVRVHGERPARATGITQVGARAGGVCGPLLFGLVATHVSYTWAWSCAGGAALGASAMMLLCRRMLSPTLV